MVVLVQHVNGEWRELVREKPFGVFAYVEVRSKLDPSSTCYWFKSNVVARCKCRRVAEQR